MFKEYLIPEQNTIALKKRFAKLQVKADRAGLQSPKAIFGITVSEPSRDAAGRPTIQRYTKVRVEWNEIEVNNWKFVAKLFHLPEGTVIKNISDRELPHHYRNAEPDCEHCKLRRNRIDTYVILDSSQGQYRQLGRDCLEQFFGVGPDKTIGQAELISSALDAALANETLPSFGTNPTMWPLEFYLAHVIDTIESNGWVPRVRAKAEGIMATSNLAFAKMTATENYLAPSEKALKEAGLAAEWAENQTGELSEYMYNLQIIAVSGAVEPRTLGYAASIVPTFRKESSTVSDLGGKSIFTGTVGKRSTFSLTVERIVDMETAYGEQCIHMMRDPSGNVLIWKTKDRLDLGKTYQIKARVKEHKEKYGIKQTILSHCKII